jgi:hypothetical protein
MKLRQGVCNPGNVKYTQQVWHHSSKIALNAGRPRKWRLCAETSLLGDKSRTEFHSHSLSYFHRNLFIFVTDSSVGIMILLRVGRPRNRTSIRCRDKTFIFACSSEARPSVHPVGTWGSSPRAKRPAHESEHSPPSTVEVKIYEGMIPLLYLMSWSITHRKKLRSLLHCLRPNCVNNAIKDLRIL